MDVKPDGSGIESTGWFHNKDEDDDQDRIHENILSRLCALDWVVLLFQHVVPDTLKDEVCAISFMLAFDSMKYCHSHYVSQCSMPTSS
jgi:hypothetical protein